MYKHASGSFCFSLKVCKHIKLHSIIAIRTHHCVPVCMSVCVLQSVLAYVCGSGLNVCDQKCEWASEIEWAHLWAAWLRGPLWDRGETEDDFMTLRRQDQGQKQRRRWRWCGERGSPSCQLWGAAGRLSGSPAWPPGCLVATARPWNAPTHNELLGLTGHSDLITTLKS